MKKGIVIVFMLLSNMLLAQMNNDLKITGKVVDFSNNAIGFTEVVLKGKDFAFKRICLTDENGNFVFEVQGGSYEIDIMQSDKVVFSKSIELNESLDLGFLIIENVNILNAVTIQGKKKLVERKVDRLVFNVENSINATGGDALDALSVSPGVRVQNDKISMIGKSTLAVMVDDKLIQLTEDNLANYLKSIPSDAIKSIEIITTPPAKYEATGNSGLLNIILKKAKKDSWNALLSSSYIQRKYGDGFIMGNFNYNKNKLSIASDLSYRDGSKYISQDDYAYFPDGLWYTSSPFKKDYKRFNGSLNLDYKLTPMWTIGSQLMVSANNTLSTDSPYTPVYNYNTNEIIRYLKSDGNTVQHPNMKSINIYNEFKMDTVGRKIMLNFDYFNLDNTDTKNYNGLSVVESPYSEKYFRGININDQNITNLSGKLDVDYPLDWAKLSFGGKISVSKAVNNISSFNSGIVDDPIVDLPLTFNEFEYTEDVQALYFSGHKKINAHWESQFGLRMEATQAKTFAANLDQRTKNQYVKFFPTAYISYLPNENSTFTLSYSRRIVRPSFYELNPNVYFINPFQTIEGNPFLQPSFVDNFEFTYTYKKLESKLYASYENNLFFQIPIADPDTNFIRFTNENYIDTRRFGISENYVFDKYKWWTSNNAIDVNYAISYSSLLITQARQSGFNSRISTANDFLLNPNKTLLLNLSYWYAFPGIIGIYDNKPMSSLSATIQYLMLNKDLKISLKGNDLLRTEKIDMSSKVNGVYQNGKYYYDTQSIQLSISYRFGSKKVKIEKREKGNESERSRTGN